MFKPSPILAARLRLTTKQVNGGYYKGNRTGSMGAHTEYGGYLIDYRKVRHFNCPDLTDFQLTPFVTQQMEPTELTQTRPDGSTFTPKFVDGIEYLQQWRRENLYEYDQVVEYQKKLDKQPPLDEQLQVEEQQQLETSPNASPQKEPALSSGQSTSGRRTSGRAETEKERSPPTA